VGELFTSFEEAWEHFLRREEPLEDFLAGFAENVDATLEGWLVEPPADVKLATMQIQAALSCFDWLVPVPGHFLHVWVGLRETIGDAWRGWSGLEPFAIAYRRVNCFHSAVVVEVEGPTRQLVAGTPNDAPEFLPHMTIAVTRQAAAPDELRDVLRRLRDSRLGEQVVREVQHVRFPAARTTVLQPWSVEQLVSLR
jgi:hypothetical protein